jgi:hypothetical protein
MKDYPTQVALPPGGKYKAIWFRLEDSAALYSSDKTVTAWYNGNTQYDWSLKKCKRTAAPTTNAPATGTTDTEGTDFLAKIKTEIQDCNNFRDLIWK